MLDTVATLNWNILDKEHRYGVFIYQRAKNHSDRIKASWFEFADLDPVLLKRLNDTVDEYMGEYNQIEEKVQMYQC